MTKSPTSPLTSPPEPDPEKISDEELFSSLVVRATKTLAQEQEMLALFEQSLSKDPPVAAKQRKLLALARDESQPHRAAEIRGLLEVLLAEVAKTET